MIDSLCLSYGRVVAFFVLIGCVGGCDLPFKAYQKIEKDLDRVADEENREETAKRLATVDGFILVFSGDQELDDGFRYRSADFLKKFGLEKREARGPGTVAIEFKIATKQISYRTPAIGGFHGKQNSMERERAKRIARTSDRPVRYKQWYQTSTAVKKWTDVTMSFADGNSREWRIDSIDPDKVFSGLCAEILRRTPVEKSVYFLIKLNNKMATDCIKGMDSDRDTPFYRALAEKPNISTYIYDGILFHEYQIPSLDIEPIVRRNFSAWLNNGNAFKLPGYFAEHYHDSNKKASVDITDDNIVFDLIKTFNDFSQNKKKNILEYYVKNINNGKMEYSAKQEYVKFAEVCQYNWIQFNSFIRLVKEQKPKKFDYWWKENNRLATNLISELVRKQQYDGIQKETIHTFPIDRQDLKLIAANGANIDTRNAAKWYLEHQSDSKKN